MQFVYGFDYAFTQLFCTDLSIICLLYFVLLPYGLLKD